MAPHIDRVAIVTRSEFLRFAWKLTPTAPSRAPWETDFMADLASPPASRHPSTDDLLTPDQRAALLANGHRSAAGADIDPRPVVKLFTPDANATWLLTELDPGEPDRAFGLCDLGLGCPELGYVALSELRALRGPLGLPVEADQSFVADRPLSNYAVLTQADGWISI